jgi:NitT/TauT family transport system substrate-binding protein
MSSRKARNVPLFGNRGPERQRNAPTKLPEGNADAQFLAAPFSPRSPASPLHVPARWTPVKIMVGSIGKRSTCPQARGQLGFFKEQGLILGVQLRPPARRPPPRSRARCRAWSFTIHHRPATKGKFITSVVQFAVAPGEVVLVKGPTPTMKDPPAGRAKNSVTGLGSATDFLTARWRRRLDEAGITRWCRSAPAVPGGDAAGKIVSGMTTGRRWRAVKAGRQVGIDLRTPEATRAALGGDYPGYLPLHGPRLDGSQRETAQKVVNASSRR